MTTSNREEVREFLMTRRAKLDPGSVGLPTSGQRRVPGLRRTEVAMLAGVSVEYYSRLERGDLTGASEGVLHAIGEALRLDEAERDHLFDLARTANAPLHRPRRPRVRTIRPALQHVVDAVTGGPAFVRDGRLDLLASNALGRALYADLYRTQPRPVNLARFAFLQRDLSERFHPDWSLAADQCVAVLRTEAGRDPCDRSLQDLVGELSTRSDEFRRRWGRHDVRTHATGTKRFHHPVAGDLDLLFEGVDLKSDPGLSLLIYAAVPGSATADGLRLLASWWATQQEDPAADPGPAAVGERARPA